MRNTIAKMTVALMALGMASAYAGDVNIGVSVSGQIQPGVYGRIDIGNTPPPPVIYAQPILIAPPPQHVRLAPLYLNVPPGHARKWDKHCHRYNACGQPVYFVRTNEYARDSHYSGHHHDHDYDRYRYDDRGHDGRGNDGHGNSGNHGDNGKHHGNKHKGRDND
jgi:hypothetical protein